MKPIRIISSIAVALLAMVATSCNDDKFLEEEYFSASDVTYFKSEANIIQSLNACYRHVEYLMVGQSHGQHSWMLQGMGLDTFASTNVNAEWAVNWPSINVGNGTTRHWYAELYKTVGQCNTTIWYIDNSDIKWSTPTIQKELRAEATLIKAFAYRCLAAMFGNVPIIEERITEPRWDYVPNTRQEVWEYEYKILNECREDLPTTPRMIGTVTRAAADAFLAEVCLALGKYDEAVTAAKNIIEKKDGDYEIMTSRFGSRAGEATDRYGNSLAAPQGAYWDLFREGGNQDPQSGNKEAIWTLQYSYGNWSSGGGGDSWSRIRSNVLECAWTGSLLVGNQGTFVKDGKMYYKYGDNIACYPNGKTATSAKVEPVDAAGKKASEAEYNGTPDPSKYVVSALGRHIANVAQDSIGARVSYAGQVCVPTRYMWDKTKGDAFNLWKDGNDFRGSETMIQRNWFTAGGTRFLDEKKAMYQRQKDGLYTLTAGDTMNTFIPRLWKFSDDKHPNGDTKAYNQEYYMFRVAEVYLLLAEAYLAKKDKGQAATAINVVRSRAGASPCSAADINIDYILDERARELLGEEHRWVTLNRLSCNPNCDYISDCYPVQDDVTSNNLYARTRKYGYGYENDAQNENGRREKRTDGYGAWYSNITPHNYLFPIPTQVKDSNTGYDYPQNPGY